MVNKSIILKDRDFKKDIISIINQSGLPVFIIKLELESILKEVENLEQQEYNEELNAYNEALSKEEKEEK